MTEYCSNCSHRLPVQSFLEVPFSLVLVLLLSEQAVLLNHLFLPTYLHQLLSQTLLLLRLTCQTTNHLVFQLRLLKQRSNCWFDPTASISSCYEHITSQSFTCWASWALNCSTRNLSTLFCLSSRATAVSFSRCRISCIYLLLDCNISLCSLPGTSLACPMPPREESAGMGWSLELIMT